MILFKHSHSNDTCFLMQTLRSWNGHCNYGLERMYEFFQELCIQLYTHSYSVPLTMAQQDEVYTIINNLMWGRRGRLSTLDVNGIESQGRKGVPIVTLNTTYILSMFKSTPIYSMSSIYAHIGRVLTAFNEEPDDCIDGLNGIDSPTDETLNRYVKVGTYLKQMFQNSVINRDLNIANSERVNVIPITTIGAYHSEEQIENWRYYIEQVFTREIWEAYAIYFGHTLNISNEKFNADKLKDLQCIISNFTPKMVDDQEFNSYVNV